MNSPELEHDQTRWKFQQYFNPNRATHIANLEDALATAEKKCREACGASEPSAGHDWFDELAGLLRVTRGQRDDLECSFNQAQLTALEVTLHLTPERAKELRWLAERIDYTGPDVLSIPRHVDDLIKAARELRHMADVLEQKK